MVSFPPVSPPRPYTPPLLTHTRHMPSPSHSTLHAKKLSLLDGTLMTSGAVRCMGRVNPSTPNDSYRGRTAPLTSKVAFYIFIQQI